MSDVNGVATLETALERFAGGARVYLSDDHASAIQHAVEHWLELLQRSVVQGFPDDFPTEGDVLAAFDALSELDWTVPRERLEAALWAVAEYRRQASEEMV
jgi:hypothetical protein